MVQLYSALGLLGGGSPPDGIQSYANAPASARAAAVGGGGEATSIPEGGDAGARVTLDAYLRARVRRGAPSSITEEGEEEGGQVSGEMKEY